MSKVRRTLKAVGKGAVVVGLAALLVASFRRLHGRESDRVTIEGTSTMIGEDRLRALAIDGEKLVVVTHDGNKTATLRVAQRSDIGKPWRAPSRVLAQFPLRTSWVEGTTISVSDRHYVVNTTSLADQTPYDSTTHFVRIEKTTGRIDESTEVDPKDHVATASTGNGFVTVFDRIAEPHLRALILPDDGPPSVHLGLQRAIEDAASKGQKARPVSVVIAGDQVVLHLEVTRRSAIPLRPHAGIDASAAKLPPPEPVEDDEDGPEEATEEATEEPSADDPEPLLGPRHVLIAAPLHGGDARTLRSIELKRADERVRLFGAAPGGVWIETAVDEEGRYEGHREISLVPLDGGPDVLHVVDPALVSLYEIESSIAFAEGGDLVYERCTTPFCAEEDREVVRLKADGSTSPIAVPHGRDLHVERMFDADAREAYVKLVSDDLIRLRLR